MPLRQVDGIASAMSWLTARGALGLCSDSRQLQAGEAFIAWPGQAQDGRLHVPAALAAGAPACLVEADGVEAFGFDGSQPVAALPGLKAATGELAAAWYGHPSEALRVLAVTGTNGKTSVSWWLAQALSALGRRCGVVGTLGIGCPPDLVSTGLTTPDPVSLQRAFRRFVAEGFEACAIEASSIGIEEHRLVATRVDVALFTNFTQDHLDYHGSMAAYWQSKARLFAWPGLKAAVLNLDDERGAQLEQALAAGAVDCWTVSRRQAARLRASEPAYADGGLCFDIVESGERVHLATALIGDFNLSNLLVVVGGLRALGVSLADAARACATLQPVPGRMQRLGGGPAQPLAVVDYAHTPDALDKALQALLPLVAARGGVLWCVFGCGGNRDAGKRPLMAALAERHAGRVVLTSDNPRRESPAAILADLQAGLQAPARALVIEDRREAIACALREAAAADVVLIAGKGHEDYQEIAGERRPFSDLAVAQQALAERAGAGETAA